MFLCYVILLFVLYATNESLNAVLKNNGVLYAG